MTGIHLPKLSEYDPVTSAEGMASLSKKMVRMYLFIIQESMQPVSRLFMMATVLPLTLSRVKKVLLQQMSL